MNIIVFEDKHVDSLFPFCINHASFELKVGLFSNLERIKNLYKNSKITLLVRKEIEDLIKFRYPKDKVNPQKIPSGVYLNGAIVYNKKIIFKENSSNVLIHNSRVYYGSNNCSINKTELSDFFSKESDEKNIVCNENIVYHLWDVINQMPDQILFDCKKVVVSNKYKKENSSIFINKKNIYIKRNANIRAGVILDAERGPIIIGENVILDIGSLIQGPVIIDDNTYIAPGSKIRGNTLIGKNCKVGGEVSSSVLYANSNKVHDGFLGNSFIGEWVNIGAGTNTSNLKNNYNKIRLDYGSKVVNTEQIFLGSLIGDFTRIGISTMLNTGTYIGLGANVFGDGFQNKFIPSFSWGKSQIVDFKKFIDTCSKMKSRRNKDLSKTEEVFLKKLYSLL